MISHFVVAKLFPKETEVNPARIPPQTPPAGGKSAEAGRIHIPSQLFRPAESGLVLFEKGSRKVYNYSIKGFVAQLARASVLHTEGHRFESCRAHHFDLRCFCMQLLHKMLAFCVKRRHKLFFATLA